MRSNREAMLDVCRTRGARMRRHPSASAYVSLAGSNQCSSSSLGSPRTHSPANLLVLSKLCQLLIACRDIQQIALVLRPGHLLGLNTNLFCALAPVLGIMKGGHVRLRSTGAYGCLFHLFACQSRVSVRSKVNRRVKPLTYQKSRVALDNTRTQESRDRGA